MTTYNTEKAPPCRIFESAWDFNNFSKQDYSVNNAIFDGLIYRGQTVVINSEKNAGSTWMTLEISRAVSSQDKLFGSYPYQPPTGMKNDSILFFVAGIPLINLHSRIDHLKTEEPNKDKYNDLYIFSKEDHLKHGNNTGAFDLTRPDWIINLINALEAITDQHFILIFDSLDTLAPVDSDSNTEFDDQIKNLHQKPNITQIWVDKGKRKGLFPTECIDLQLRLKSRKDRGNVAMEVTFEKANALPKDQTQPFIIELKECGDGAKMKFERLSSEIDNENIAIVMMIEGKTQNEIAKVLKVSQATVSNWRAIAASKGLIEIRGHNSIPTAQGEKLVKSMKLYMR